MYEAEVNAGVKFLDEKLGRDVWLGRVNTRRLDLSDNTCCVVTQASGENYNANPLHLFLREKIGLGFQIDIEDEEYDMNMRSLTEAWKKKIIELRKTAP